MSTDCNSHIYPLMLKRIKDRLLGEDRTAAIVAEVKSLYESADDPEAFNDALQEGDFEAAAEYHPLSAAELKRRFDRIRENGEALEADYSELADSGKEEFINA